MAHGVQLTQKFDIFLAIALGVDQNVLLKFVAPLLAEEEHTEAKSWDRLVLLKRAYKLTSKEVKYVRESTEYYKKRYSEFERACHLLNIKHELKEHIVKTVLGILLLSQADLNNDKDYIAAMLKLSSQRRRSKGDGPESRASKERMGRELGILQTVARIFSLTL